MVAAEKPSLDVTLDKTVRQGKKQIILCRELGKEEAALNLLWQTESEIGMSKDSDTEATKSGPIAQPGEIEYDFSVTCYMAVNDPAVTMLKRCFMENKLVELWNINLQHKKPEGTNQYASDYYQAYVSSFTPTAPADEMVELEFEFTVDGVHQEGWATVTDAQEDGASYEFVDTTTEAAKAANLQEA